LLKRVNSAMPEIFSAHKLPCTRNETPEEPVCDWSILQFLKHSVFIFFGE
jgi:hypothetical protein